MMNGKDGMNPVTRYEPTPEWLAELNSRIDAGVEWLTQVKGKTWDRGIDLSNLKMSFGWLCVLGQCFRDEAHKSNNGISGFLHVLDTMGMTFDEARRRGFNFSHSWDFNNDYKLEEAQWSLLGDLWKARILAKRRREKRNLLRG